VPLERIATRQLAMGWGPYFKLRGFVVDKDDEYRRFAREALDLADRSNNNEDKATWLRIAQKYLDLLPKRERTLAEQFDDHTKARGMGQEDSGSSH
jgi:hypothetical protein